MMDNRFFPSEGEQNEGQEKQRNPRGRGMIPWMVQFTRREERGGRSNSLRKATQYLL